MASSKWSINKKFSDNNKKHLMTNNLTIKGSSNNCLRMKVNSGTKMKNALEYALKMFPQQYDNIIWTGAGQAVGKVISCVELFKSKNPDLHQVTKLHYISNETNLENTKKKQQIPEINIYLSKESLDVTESGYQCGCDGGIFRNSSIDSGTSHTAKSEHRIKNMGVMSSRDVEEFTAMGLRTNEKRSRNNQTKLQSISNKGKNVNNKIRQT